MAQRTARAALILCLLLSACATEPQVITHVVTQRVDVPVPTRAPAPNAALDCRAAIPAAPHFTTPTTDAGLLLKPGEIPALRNYINGWVRCDNIWRAWATSPTPLGASPFD